MTYTYSDLHFYEWMLHELKKQPNSKPEIVEAKIIDMKRQLRANSKRTDEHQTVHDDGIDGFITKFPLPEYITTRQDADEYFREYEYIRMIPSAYDCTGQRFTAWYKLFQKPDGRFLAYHSVGIDM